MVILKGLRCISEIVQTVPWYPGVTNGNSGDQGFSYGSYDLMDLWIFTGLSGALRACEKTGNGHRGYQRGFWHNGELQGVIEGS